MLISAFGFVLLAGVSTAIATWLAFAQFAIFSSIAEHETEAGAGEDYADLALVTRIMERPRAVYLQLGAVRTVCRWITIGCVVALGLIGGASHLFLAGVAALALFVLEEELPLRLVLRDPARWALRLLPPLAAGLQLLNAASPLLEWIYRLSHRLVRNRAGGEPPMSVEELTAMAAAGGADLGVDERRMLRGI